MVDYECSTNNCKSLKSSITAIIKNPRKLKFVSDHIKTKNILKHAVKKFPFVKKLI